MASRGDAIATGCAVEADRAAERRGRCRRSARASSVRPAPTRPARPRISPRRSDRSTRWSGWACGRAGPRSRSTAVAGGRGRAGGRATSGRGRSSAGSSRRGRSRPCASSPTTRAVAQHHDPVGAVLDLVQAVRDEDDADAVGLEVGDDLQQPRRSRTAVRLEVGSSMMTRRASSDSALAISTSWRWASDRSATGVSGPKSTPSRSQQRRDACARARARSISCSGPPQTRLAADEDVGRDVEIVEEVELLVHEGDAGRDRARRR